MKADVVFGFEHAAWPALLVAPAGEIMLANPAAKELFGPALKDIPAPLTPIWAGEHGGTPAEFLARWEQKPSATCPLKWRAADGTITKFTTAVCQFQNGEKRWFVLQLFPLDRADQPTTSAAAPDADAILKQKLDCVLQLARTVSLDFNNALTGVLAHTSLLLTKAAADHPWRRSLLEVEKSGARAAEIASELAQFSRPEKEARPAPASNLNLVVGRCVEIFQGTHGTRFTWKLALERALFISRFDETKVQLALTKIIENAVEAFGTSGNGQISVQTRNVELTAPTQDRNVQLQAGTYVCVEIADSGGGIEPEELPRIFEPFFTTKRPPHRGLGLALVYGMIANHGGGVAISSQPGRGTSARIYLPAEKIVTLEPGAGHRDLRGAGTVLFVDDEGLVLTMAETILTEFGYQVLTAGNGQKALALLSLPNAKVDLVITDLVMPGMGGRELAGHVRQTHPHLPILLTSGYVNPENTKSGANFLPKPFTSTELLRKVKSALTTQGS